MHIKRWLTALSLSLLLWSGRSFAQTDSTDVAQDSLKTKKENWFQRLQKRDQAFDGKDVRTTISLTDIKVRFRAGEAQISPIVGYNALTNRYTAGVTAGQDASEHFRFEAGYFFRGNFDSETTRSNYRQYFLRGIFNLKSPPGKIESNRRIVVETGGFDRKNYLFDETGVYLSGNFEKSMPKFRIFGKKDTDKTILLGAYAQIQHVGNEQYTNLGLRAQMMKPLDYTILKSVRFRVRVGPVLTLDSREGFTAGYRIVQSLNVFHPKP